MPAPLLKRTLFWFGAKSLMAATLLLLVITQVQGDEPDNLNTLRRRAETGLPAAQYVLGNAYMSGEGVTENPVEASQWYKKAAEQGHAEAQFNLGMMYYEGVGVQMDRAEAIKWYTSAANRGVAEAQYNLAVAYSKGEGVPQNPVEAFKWYQTAAEAWDTRAQLQVGLAYRDGNGVQADEGEAIKWLRRAAYQNEPAAQYALGVIYGNANSAFHNQEDSKRWLQRAADLNYAPALAMQGGGTNQVTAPVIKPEAAKALLARDGIGTIGTNLPVSLTHTGNLDVASSLPMADSTNSLPSNIVGETAPPFGQLSEFTNQAKLAEGGSAEAQWNIAMSFLMGEQEEADVEKAIPWLEKAAAQKHVRAEVLLRKLNAFRSAGANSTHPEEKVQTAEETSDEHFPTAVAAPNAEVVDGPKPLGLGSILMISLGSSILVIAGTAALIYGLLKSRFARLQRDLLETKLELAEANRNVKKLNTFIQNIENKMLEASLEPPPIAAKNARPLPNPSTNGNNGSQSEARESGVEFKVKRGRNKGAEATETI